jgi:hypothetical protein
MLSRLAVVVSLALVIGLTCAVGAPAPFPRRATDLPVGRWRVEFANGVVQNCEIHKNGTIAVVEPHRNSPGRATIRDGSVVIVCEDDRAERWTWKGHRLVVEHWYPVSAYPAGKSVLGVAERIR